MMHHFFSSLKSVSTPQVLRGEEKIVAVHAPRHAQGMCGETRHRSLFRTTKIRFYPAIFATFCFLAELGAQKWPKMGFWSAGERFFDRHRPPWGAIVTEASKAARTPIEHDERSSSMWRSANPSKGAKASITRSVIPPPVSRAVQCRRSDRTAKNGENR